MTSDINDEQTLLTFVIELFCDRLLPRSQLMELLSILCLTHKGLTEVEILKASKISQKDLSRVLNIFSNFTMCFKGYWVCSNEIFRHAVERMYYGKPEVRKEIHKRIADALEKTPSCVRKLEEQTYHLYCAGDNFTLKQIIATVENFLMLFNPMTKFDLFRYWQDLETLGYDPVTEYNKGIEMFDSHYDPEPDKLFMIILQVCRFLKEFSDFETDFTPSFRHPSIKGKIGVIRKSDKEEEGESNLGKTPTTSAKSPIKMKTQKEKLVPKINGKTNRGQGKRKLKYDDPAKADNPFYDEDNELSDVESRKDFYDNTNEDKTFNYLEVIGLFDELKKFSLTKDTDGQHIDSKVADAIKKELRYEEKNTFKRRFHEILDDWEDVNIEVPEGRQRFRDRFLQILEERNIHRQRALERDEDEKLESTQAITEKEETDVEKGGMDQSTFHKEEDYFKHKYLQIMDEIDLEIKPEKDPSFYYYKRWIWIIFPWICMTVKDELDFSKVIARCYSSATKYMRIDEEKQFYRCKPRLTQRL